MCSADRNFLTGLRPHWRAGAREQTIVEGTFCVACLLRHSPSGVWERQRALVWGIGYHSGAAVVLSTLQAGATLEPAFAFAVDVSATHARKRAAPAEYGSIFTLTTAIGCSPSTKPRTPISDACSTWRTPRHSRVIARYSSPARRCSCLECTANPQLVDTFSIDCRQAAPPLCYHAL
jgi:hypothetical protein